MARWCASVLRYRRIAASWVQPVTVQNPRDPSPASWPLMNPGARRSWRVLAHVCQANTGKNRSERRRSRVTETNTRAVVEGSGAYSGRYCGHHAVPRPWGALPVGGTCDTQRDARSAEMAGHIVFRGHPLHAANVRIKY